MHLSNNLDISTWMSQWHLKPNCLKLMPHLLGTLVPLSGSCTSVNGTISYQLHWVKIEQKCPCRLTFNQRWFPIACNCIKSLDSLPSSLSLRYSLSVQSLPISASRFPWLESLPPILLNSSQSLHSCQTWKSVSITSSMDPLVTFHYHCHKNQAL